MPRALAMSPTSVGSMPSTRWPAFLKFDSSVPSLEPISTTRSSLPRPSMAADLALQVGEIVAQQLGGAAGVGIFRREDDDRIDREAELHQVAVAAMQQVGRKPRLLARHLADRHHLVDRRHVAERRARRRACRVPQTWQHSTGTLAPVPAARATLVGRKGELLRAEVRSGLRRQIGVAPVPVERGFEALRRAARAAYSPARPVSKYRGSGAACRRPAAARRRARSRARRLAPCAAPARRSPPLPWCRRDRCRDARPSRA